MAIYIKNFAVEDFRGVHKLHLKEMNHVNVVVGDNNCGKTSVLEAFLLLRNPKSWSNIIRVARL